MIDQLVINAIAGGLGGLTREIIGYLGRPEDEPFKSKAFFRSLVISTIAGVSVGYIAVTNPVGTFLSAIGIDALLKEVYNVAKPPEGGK